MPTKVSPKKLLNSKWTAVQPRNRERHLMVVGIVEPEPPGSPVVSIELEAVHSRRIRVMPWRELTDPLKWRQGWV
jgi:tryptophan-rich hypothetical protein